MLAGFNFNVMAGPRRGTVLLRSFSWEFSKTFRELILRSSHQEVFLERGVLKICSKFIGEQPRRSVISIKLKSNLGVPL